MTTHRERILAALEFTGPDKIPVILNPSAAGLYVHGQKIVDLFNEFSFDNRVTVDKVPAPPPGTIDQKGRNTING